MKKTPLILEWPMFREHIISEESLIRQSLCSNKLHPRKSRFNGVKLYAALPSPYHEEIYDTSKGRIFNACLSLRNLIKEHGKQFDSGTWMGDFISFLPESQETLDAKIAEIQAKINRLVDMIKSNWEKRYPLISDYLKKDDEKIELAILFTGTETAGIWCKNYADIFRLTGKSEGVLRLVYFEPLPTNPSSDTCRLATSEEVSFAFMFGDISIPRGLSDELRMETEMEAAMLSQCVELGLISNPEQIPA